MSSEFPIPFVRENTLYRVFGVSLASDLRLSRAIPEADPAADPPPAVTFRLRPESSLPPPEEARGDAHYESPYRNREGHVRVRALSAPERDHLRFGERLHFSLEADRISCHFTAPVRPREIEIHLLGAVLAYWLERQGFPCVHASAVVTPGGAIGFLAGNGGGKSALAASLVSAGCPLLTDDVLALEERDGLFYGRSSYPQMRFWPREAELFTGRSAGYKRVHPEVDKVRVPVGEAGFGTFHPHPAPLAALYLPERRPAGHPDARIAIEPVSSRDAAIELLRQSFVSHLIEGAPWAAERLARLAAIAASVPMRRLVYPSGFERLDQVREAVLKDAEALANHALARQALTNEDFVRSRRAGGLR